MSDPERTMQPMHESAELRTEVAAMLAVTQASLAVNAQVLDKRIAELERRVNALRHGVVLGRGEGSRIPWRDLREVSRP